MRTSPGALCAVFRSAACGAELVYPAGTSNNAASSGAVATDVTDMANVEDGLPFSPYVVVVYANGKPRCEAPRTDWAHEPESFRSAYQPSVSVFLPSTVWAIFRCRAVRPNIGLCSPVSVTVGCGAPAASGCSAGKFKNVLVLSSI